MTIEEEMNEKLFLYLKSTIPDKEQMMRVIQNSHLLLILSDQIKYFDFKLYGMALILRNEQTKRNKVFLKEIQKILEVCQQTDLAPVFLKGLFLAKDIYRDISKRPTSDVDLLIKREEFYRYQKIFTQLGYQLEGFADGEKEEVYMQALSEMHLVYCKEVGSFTVMFELHGTVINPPVVFDDMSHEFYQHSHVREILGLKPYVLEHEYNLIMLMLHFFKQLPALYLQNALFQRETLVNAANLHDIALYASIHQHEICWEKVITIALRMRVARFLYISAGYVNEIYGEVFEENFLRDLEKDMEQSFMAAGEYERYGLGKFSWLFQQEIEYIQKLSVMEILTGRLPLGFPLLAIAKGSEKGHLYSMDSEVELKKTYRISGEENTLEKRSYHVELSANITKERFHLMLRISDKVVCAYCNEGNLIDKDGLELMLVLPNGIRHFLYTVSKRGTEYYLSKSSENDPKDAVYEQDHSSYQLIVGERECKLILSLTLSELGVALKEGQQLGFNMTALISDEKAEKLCASCNLMKEEPYLWFFDGVAVLQGSSEKVL